MQAGPSEGQFILQLLLYPGTEQLDVVSELYLFLAVSSIGLLLLSLAQSVYKMYLTCLNVLVFGLHLSALSLHT